jgi:branched-chain amino acid transport system permease protein
MLMSMGLVSLTQAGFVGIGAYTSALLVLRLDMPFILALLCAGLVCMIISFCVGVIVLRLKTVYFVLATFAMNEFISLIFVNWVSLFGGVSGITNIPPPEFSVPFLKEAIVLDTRFSFYYFLLIITAAVFVLVNRIMKSEYGRVFKMISESDVLAQSVGINLAHFRIFGFSIAAFLCGIGGSLLAHYSSYIGPQYFTGWTSFDYLVITAVGGMGSTAGPILGSLVLTSIPELLRGLKELHLILYGAILIVFVMFLPKGLVHFLDVLKEKIYKKL